MTQFETKTKQEKVFSADKDTLWKDTYEPN